MSKLTPFCHHGLDSRPWKILRHQPGIHGPNALAGANAQKDGSSEKSVNGCKELMERETRSFTH